MLISFPHYTISYAFSAFSACTFPIPKCTRVASLINLINPLCLGEKFAPFCCMVQKHANFPLSAQTICSQLILTFTLKSTSESWQNAQMSSHIWLPHLDSELEHARYLSLSKLQMLSIQVCPSITTVDARYIFVYILVCMCLYLSASLYVSVTPKFLPCVWR